MRIPDNLAALVDQGFIEEVVRPLMSGKEAQVYLVIANGRACVAKIYKEAQNRSFKNRAEYTEGRRVRNTRDQRAMNKRTSHGRAMDEDAWRSAEVDMIQRLRSAGVRVPEPLQFIDGVLLMEMIEDIHGEPAPRLAELQLSPAEARVVFDHLLREVVRMLCAGIIHGDLSDFNVLMGADGPVVIDFPQSVDAARNQNARELLIRDVNNLTTFLGRFDPSMRATSYGQEIWQAYERAELTPESQLTGRFVAPQGKADTSAVLEEIEHAARDEDRRRLARGQAPVRSHRPETEARAARPKPEHRARGCASAAQTSPTTETAGRGGGGRGCCTQPHQRSSSGGEARRDRAGPLQPPPGPLDPTEALTSGSASSRSMTDARAPITPVARASSTDSTYTRVSVDETQVLRSGPMQAGRLTALLVMVACKASPRDPNDKADAGTPPADSGVEIPVDAGATPGRYFPAGAFFLDDVYDAPPAGNSPAILADLAAAGGWGNGNIFQIDFSIDVLTADETTPMMTFEPTDDFYDPDCDAVPMPLPADGNVEGEDGYECAGDGDCHLIVFAPAMDRLFEMWRANVSGGTFYGGCLAVWDTSRVYGAHGRGLQCTSADAAGFPIAPLLFTADEVAAGEIAHAIRFILPNNRVKRGFVPPATHGTSTTGDGDAPYYGVHLRLRRDFPLETLPSEGARTVARALQRYGMYHADGGNIALTAQSDRHTAARWSGLLEPRDLSQLQVGDFEVIDHGAFVPLTYDCVREPL